MSIELLLSSNKRQKLIHADPTGGFIAVHNCLIDSHWVDNDDNDDHEDDGVDDDDDADTGAGCTHFDNCSKC